MKVVPVAHRAYRTHTPLFVLTNYTTPHSISALLTMEPPKSSCSRCNEPTTQKCAACKSTYYCGSECQTKDWKDHKKNCKDLVMGKIIQRAGKIMQKLYLRFREDTFDACITKVVDKGNILEVYDDIKFSTRKNGWFAPFPHHLIKNERNKAAVLTAMCCNEPYAYFHDFLSIFLDSKCL
jgi:hypothetical protein